MISFLLKFIPDWLKLPLAAVVGAGLMFFPAKWIGQSEGKRMAATASLVKSVEVLRDRNTIDAEVSSSDATAMCAAFFVPDSEEHRECLRRLATPDADTGNGGQDHDGRPPVCEPGREP